MSFLNTESIKHFSSKEVQEDHRIKITPELEPFQFGQCSVDLRLGTQIFKFRRPLLRKVTRIFDTCAENNFDIHYTVIVRESFVINPNELILARTVEIVKLPKNMFGLISGRSSYSRLGLEVQLTQDLHQPGNDGFILLQIKNNSPFPIRLYPKMRIAQLLIGLLDNACSEEYDKALKSKYKNEIDGNISVWKKDKELTFSPNAVSNINYENLLNLLVLVSLIFTIIFLFKPQFDKFNVNGVTIIGAIFFAIVFFVRLIIYIKKR